jgi:hypothetical protein
MTDLFDTKDLLTIATVDQAELNTKGYFGDNLSTLIERVRQGKVETLTDTIPDVTYCFKSNNDLHYVFFLPAGKVKIKEPIYRPFNSIDELFNLFYSFSSDSVYSQAEKAEVLLGKKIVLKNRYDGSIKAIVIHDIDFNETGSDVIVNSLSLIYLFNNFEIKKDDEFVPFGIKEK